MLKTSQRASGVQVAHFYEQRQAATAGELKPLPFVNALLDPYRVWL